MAESSVSRGGAAKKFIGLSRMTHSILDVAHPAAGALLVLGAAPRASIVALGLVSAFSGFTAVFALNDVMDAKVDVEKMAKYRKDSEAFDLDSVGTRHPIAQGSLSRGAAIAWVAFWGILSLTTAFLLKPLCAALLIVAVGLEVCYCRLLRVTHWKALLSGLMVAVGGLAGVFAVTSAPSPLAVVLFALWAASWEIGGRNIPNDWSDIEEDVNLGVRTMPIRFGRAASSRIAAAFASVIILCSLAFPLAAPIRQVPVYLALAAVAGLFLLVLPALRWLRVQSTESAMAYFNKACFYPLAIFAAMAICLVV
ncbi:MAG: UbiA family prenyltransferase [Rectinemataceae bacterium]